MSCVCTEFDDKFLLTKHPLAQVHARTKSLFSTMKKLLRLGNTAKGGRARGEIFDLLGMRLVVEPKDDVPADRAEQLAAQVERPLRVHCNGWSMVLLCL